jgi:FPC/CPF motif-containing protein YcgG
VSRAIEKAEITRSFGEQDWQRRILAEFEATLTSPARAFPCVYSVNGFRANQLRFAFPDPFDAETLAPVLREYLGSARGIGRLTSLVAFARPSPVRTLESYREKFWAVLDDLARLDKSSWTAGMPESLDNPFWEFCFAGEPIFVVCTSPAHILRQSRRSTSFTITFQPRWVFQGLTDTPRRSARASAAVRERLKAFDLLPPSPALGRYGDPDSREARQYFIDDTQTRDQACPFARLGEERRTGNGKDGKGEAA